MKTEVVVNKDLLVVSLKEDTVDGVVLSMLDFAVAFNTDVYSLEILVLFCV